MRSNIEKFSFVYPHRIKFIILIFVLLNIFSIKAFTSETYPSDEGKVLLEKLKIKKQMFLLEVSKKEDYCLELFLSGACLEKLIIEHDTTMREFELKKQEISRKIRRYEADLRKEKRQKKLQNNYSK